MRILEKLKKSREKKRSIFFTKAGIVDKDGNLMPQYQER
jgi:hypothetical protein